MKREEAKAKDQKATRKDCLRMIVKYGSSTSNQVQTYLGLEGLKITSNAASTRLLELCREGELFRHGNPYVYCVNPAHRKQDCIDFYEKERVQSRVDEWKSVTEDLILMMPPHISKYLKEIKNEVNKVA